jgi:hypothetical protein
VLDESVRLKRCGVSASKLLKRRGFAGYERQRARGQGGLGLAGCGDGGVGSERPGPHGGSVCAGGGADLGAHAEGRVEVFATAPEQSSDGTVPLA